MKTEKEKMLAGEFYLCFDEELVRDRQYARKVTKNFNLSTEDSENVMEPLKKLFGKTGDQFYVEPNFHCDYGYNISVGENFYANYDCIILDCNLVTIGDNCLFAPRVSIHSATHPTNPEQRTAGLEYAKPVTIGNNVWIGGNAIINPGVTIGDNSVIGSGSVVTKDIPANVVAVGNPAKVIKYI